MLEYLILLVKIYCKKPVNLIFVGDKGLLQWTGNWVSFVDTMLQMTLLSQPGHSLCLPTRIKSLMIDPELQKKSVVQLEDQKNGMRDSSQEDLSWEFPARSDTN